MRPLPTLQDSAEARFWYFNLAGLLHAALLGAVVGADLEPFFWLLVARPLAAVLMSLLPETTSGQWRPYLVGSAVGYLGMVQLLDLADRPFQLGAMALFLFVDVALDAILATHAPSQEWVGRMGQLTFARAAGLALGLLTSSTLLAVPSGGQAAFSFLLAILIALFWTVRERADDELVQTRRNNSFVHSALLLDALKSLRDPRWALHLMTMFSVAVLAGAGKSLLFPVPVLSAPALAQWLSLPVLCVGALLLDVILALVIERAPLPVQIQGCYPLLLLAAVALPTWPGHHGVLVAVEVAGGLALLVAYRQCLEGAPLAMTPALRAAVPVATWALGMLGGQALGGRNLLLWLAIPATCLSVVTVMNLRAWTRRIRLERATAYGNESERQARTGGRHGDRRQDFTAAPHVDRRRRPATRIFRQIWHILAIRFPITLALAVMAGVVVSGLWQAKDQRQTWTTRIQNSWTATKTQLFLTSLKHRVEEELLASNRVPDNWTEFVGASFELDGRPMKDRDFWGTPLHFDNLPKEVRIVSAGPDRKLFTRDDIERVAHKPDGVR